MRTDRGANKRKEQKSDLVAGTTPKLLRQTGMVQRETRTFQKRGQRNTGENNREKERQGDTSDTD